MSRAITPLLALGYLLLAHGAAVSGRGELAALAGLLLAVLLLWPGLLARRIAAWSALTLAAAVLFWLHRHALAALPLYAPPILLNLFLAWLFGHTLRAGSVPLVERFARAMGGHPEPIDPELLRYMRRLTAAWTMLFLLLATLNLLLALLAAPGGLLISAGLQPAWTVHGSVWSLFANLLNHVFVVAFFVLEFGYRRQRFANLPYRTLGEFVRGLGRSGPNVWRRAVR